MKPSHSMRLGRFNLRFFHTERHGIRRRVQVHGAAPFRACPRATPDPVWNYLYTRASYVQALMFLTLERDDCWSSSACFNNVRKLSWVIRVKRRRNTNYAAEFMMTMTSTSMSSSPINLNETETLSDIDRFAQRYFSFSYYILDISWWANFAIEYAFLFADRCFICWCFVPRFHAHKWPNRSNSTTTVGWEIIDAVD